MVPSPPDTEFGAVLPPDLVEVLAVWNTLPGAVRAGVLALIKAAR